jgi:hypothetical protein
MATRRQRCGNRNGKGGKGKGGGGNGGVHGVGGIKVHAGFNSKGLGRYNVGFHNFNFTSASASAFR